MMDFSYIPGYLGFVDVIHWVEVLNPFYYLRAPPINLIKHASDIQSITATVEHKHKLNISYNISIAIDEINRSPVKNVYGLCVDHSGIMLIVDTVGMLRDLVAIAVLCILFQPTDIWLVRFMCACGLSELFFRTARSVRDNIAAEAALIKIKGIAKKLAPYTT